MSTEKKTTIVPLRVGIRFNPPALVYVYEKKTVDIFPVKVLRRRIMPIRDFNDSCDIQSFAQDLMDRHGKMLENVPIESVCKMLRLLREHKKGVDLKTALQIIEEETNEIGANETQKKDDNILGKNMNNTFTVEDKIKSLDFTREKEESYGIEVDRSWDDDGDDSLEMRVCRGIAKDFMEVIES